MKNTLLLLFILSALLLSCADDTSQVEELMAANEATLEEQLNILNNEGEFYNFNLKILDGNDPIEGATVVLASSKSGQIEEIRSTSDANGDIFFTDFSVGGNFITISKEGYYSVNGIINFRFEEGYNYEIVNGRVVPIERNETAILPLYSQEGNKNTAKISGKVTYEKDLTNDEPEYPAGKIIRADFTSEILQSSEGVSFNEYTISSEGINIGSGEVQEDGSYELIIPTNANGTSVRLITPEIREDQRLAWFNDEIESYEYTEMEAHFGKNVDYNYVPYVPGVIGEVSSPPVAGEGFQIDNLRKVGRRIFNDRSYIYTTESREIDDNTIYSFYGGSNYQSTPTIRVEDPTGTDFSADIEMEAAVQRITMTEIGKYPANGFVRAEVYANKDGLGRLFASFSINADANGHVSQDIIDSVFPSLEDYYSTSGFGDSYRDVNEFDNFTIYFSNSTAASDPLQAQAELEYNAKITGLNIKNKGKNYTDPEFVFEGGDTSSPAALNFSFYGARWGIKLDNSNITTPYTVEPDIRFQYINKYNNISTTSYVTNDSLGYSYGASQTMNEELEIDENGELKFRAGSPYYTNFYSDEEPIVIIEQDQPKKASLKLLVDFETGKLIGVENYYKGRGYNEPFEVTIKPSIEGLPGEGAEVSIIGGSYNDRGEYEWSGLIAINNPGANYLYFLNRGENYFNISGSSDIEILPGEEIYRDVEYGTGRRIME
ncbi:hypothetical protein ABWH96_10965 [Marivirga tractuosa]|uniref:hypothetical protein n=1 Tax=Marivirga tractuosa TaxID=1006 RepID=UPI0035CFDE82